MYSIIQPGQIRNKNKENAKYFCSQDIQLETEINYM